MIAVLGDENLDLEEAVFEYDGVEYRWSDYEGPDACKA